MTNSKLPIGVFDSGVGGLTVLRALQNQLPQENFLYLGDTARLPYGTKSKDTIIAYSKQASQILIERGVKLLVVACNTASTLSLEALQANFPHIPVFGVLKPGAEAACAISQNGHIAVIGTEATVNANGYQEAILQLRPTAQVVAKSCGLFVSLAEEGLVAGAITEKIAAWYLKPLLKNKRTFKPDCLVLGCTHFPVLLPAIKKIIGNQIHIINSAEAAANHIANQLIQLKLQNNQQTASKRTFLVTDAPDRFAKVATAFLNEHLAAENIELVDCR